MPATHNALKLRTSVGDPNDPEAEFTCDHDTTPASDMPGSRRPI